MILSFLFVPWKSLIEGYYLLFPVHAVLHEISTRLVWVYQMEFITNRKDCSGVFTGMFREILLNISTFNIGFLESSSVSFFCFLCINCFIYSPKVILWNFFAVKPVFSISGRAFVQLILKVSGNDSIPDNWQWGISCPIQERRYNPIGGYHL